MSARFDYVVVGSGLTGATIARVLSHSGSSVLVVDRRSHVGGNVFDSVHESGIRVHRYGPHYFRTSSRRIWRFVRQFSDFYPYEAKILTRVNGSLEPWPIAGSYIRREFPSFVPGPVDGSDGHTFESRLHAIMPPVVFDRFIREYSEKQWGVPAQQLSADLALRVRVHWDDDPRLTPRAKYQGLPAGGYASLVVRMLDGVSVETGVDYLRSRPFLTPKKMLIFTGPIDEYFDFVLGRLAYRAQERSTDWLAGVEAFQPAAQVNEAQHASGMHIRTIEWKHLMPEHDRRRSSGTVVTRETPFSPADPDQYEYPFPDERNALLYQQHRRLAAHEPQVLICGRLGEYRYFDMDQAIGRGLMWAARVLRTADVKPRQAMSAIA